jgi:hypothetical protein
MSTDIPARPVAAGGLDQSGLVTGLAMFAGVMMIILGVWQVLAGFAALVHDELYVGTPNYIFAFDLTGWGWVHLLLGVAVAVAGVAVIRGLAWGRWVGIGVASVSIIANFMILPHYPLWSILIIALDVAVVWALCVYRSEPA